MNNICCITIPVYKKQLDNTEQISLKQCIEILGSYPICLVAPKTLNVSEYLKYSEKLKIQRFDDGYFRSIQDYNRLMLSAEFYERFLKYKYVLIYQLDCYVFRDELTYWCNKGYDFIGAPWFTGFEYLSFVDKIIFKSKRKIHDVLQTDNMKRISHRVGNGGFSLRNTYNFLETIKKTDKAILEKFAVGDGGCSFFNEDVFWGVVCKEIKKPNYKIAARFSLEKPEFGLKLNNGAIPFGIHKWRRLINFIPELKQYT